MQLSKIALAVGAVCAVTAATAGPNANRIAVSAGASAVQDNVRKAVESLCKAPNVFTSFVSGNFTTVVCADIAITAGNYPTKINTDFKNFDGLPFAEIRFNVSNGSFGSVQILNSPVDTAPVNFKNLAVIPANPVFTFRSPTGTVENLAGTVIIGGISDTETNRFPGASIAANKLYKNTKLGAAQTFGVAASSALYTKMFDAQKLAGLIPASCGVNDTTIPYCIPNIAKAQMASIMSSNDTNAAYVKGLAFLTGDAADDGVELRYVRRVDTSGTQSSAQNYFLGLPCSLSILDIVAEPKVENGTSIAGGVIDVKIENIRVYAAGGTSNVRGELNAGAGVYALGVMSGENNQTGQTWRWLRVDGAPIGEDAAPGALTTTNTNTLKDGSYSFYFEATYTGGDPLTTLNDTYWAKIATAFGTLPAPVGLVNQSGLNAGFSKGGLTCRGSSSN